MKIVSTNVFVGPSLYAHFPVIRHVVDLGILEEWPTAKLGDSFIDGLIDQLPGLKEHGCSYGEPGGFIRRMREDEGTWLGHVLEHVAIELQHEAGSDVTFGKTRSTGNPGEYNMVFQYKQRDVGLEASRLGRQLILHLLPQHVQDLLDQTVDDDFDVEEEKTAFIRFAQRKEFGPSTQSLVDAAVERGIPWLRLNKYSLVQFGHGKFQKRIQATITSETRHIAVEIACDKEDTHHLLNDLGLPVPQQEMVYSVRQAVRMARRIGYPVVLKPLNANHGRGVSINLTEDNQVETAFAFAREEGTSRAVLVESFQTGFDHRMLVINNQLVAVAKRVPGHVVGDGTKTIEQLVEQVNEDPRRGIGHEKVLTRLEFDKKAMEHLDEAGYTKQTVLEKDEILYLRSTANLSTGGTAIDLTDVVHPDNRAMAVRAISAVGLDVGGVDFLTDDISQSYKDIGGAIVEVNAAPGFRMHVAPSEGKPRDVAGPVMDMLFPSESLRRIPIAGITGTNGKTTTSRMLSHIMKGGGATVGMTSTDGVYIDGHLSVKGDMTGPVSAQIVLRDPSVDMAVLETARGGLVKRGLGYNKSNVAACLNISADHLGMRGIDTLEQLAELKRIVVEVAQDVAVLNADDDLCLKMADYSQAERICYFTLNPNHELVREHIRAGGLACVLEQGINGHMITLFDGGAHIPLLWTHLIPATLEGKAVHNVQNAMCASAMAYSLGATLEDIRHGLRTFDTSFFQAPGRMNVFDEHPFKVILDYAHNPAAVEAMCKTAAQLSVQGKRIAVLAAPGDRRDQDIDEIGRLAAGNFDYYLCKADDDRRGRGFDEAPQRIRTSLLEEGVSDDTIKVIPDEQACIDHALRMANHGDLVLIFGDDTTRSWKQIIGYDSEGHPVESGTVPVADVVDLPVLSEYHIETSDTLIRDEKGVRLAREEND
ncbi:MAG: cyanophycin synthetase [Bacteroidetes Order II. Incertae sedis bacterium]|jgi:cyanophycin synthetase|nr:cyanophycin synthetase [Bacteroidetes Order II. bacterium]MBT6201643.1 cyanophycin synthetase [Bacteroidetes Order II. bacterium]MBT6425479.1 cyanophycin synthetase [Bacteroidetes Order II. bacterium]MBT6598335.1 cyanophycin synthetase [Bacteroidetes Order II. bacterium]MBT7402050.1 cyanophycin synthetase [Bacteroidetes Order II. bacterium]